MAVIAYWPLDDPPGSSEAVSAVGGAPLLARVNVGIGITPTAEFAPFAWRRGTLYQWLPPTLQAESGGDLQGGRLIKGKMARRGVDGEWALDFLYRATAEPGNDSDFPMGNQHIVRQTDGIEWSLQLNPDTDQGEVVALAADGSFLGGSTFSTFSLHNGQVWHVRLEVADGGGGDADWTFRMIRPIADLTSGGTVAIGTALRAPERYELFWSRSELQDRILPFHIGQIIIWDNAPLSVFSVNTIIQGNQSETPLERIRRLCGEEGVPFSGFGSPAIHERATILGPQQTDTFLGLLREAERSSAGGVLYELAGGLAYATVEQRYNQVPELEFDISTEPRLSESPEPIDDDQQLRNQVTVTKAITGEVVTREDATSIAESGVQPLDIKANPVGSEQLDQIASWLLAVGLATVDDYRWPELSLDLARNPELIIAWLDFRLGGRVQVTGLFPTQLPGHLVDALADGWSETVRSLGDGRVQWQVKLNAVPARPYTVGVFADDAEAPDPDAPQRYSPFDSRTSAGFTSGTDTALSVEDQTGGNDLWSQTADFPFDILVSGVRLRVTAIGAPTGAVQVMTVEQAPINGVEKTIPIGEQVELWTPARYAL